MREFICLFPPFRPTKFGFRHDIEIKVHALCKCFTESPWTSSQLPQEHPVENSDSSAHKMTDVGLSTFHNHSLCVGSTKHHLNVGISLSKCRFAKRQQTFGLVYSDITQLSCHMHDYFPSIAINATGGQSLFCISLVCV
jgi:hypothetical protein